MAEKGMLYWRKMADCDVYMTVITSRVLLSLSRRKTCPVTKQRDAETEPQIERELNEYQSL